MNKTCFWACLFSLLYQSLYAQTPIISGRIIDAITQVPLPQVKIAKENSFEETFSDPEGKFSLEIDGIISKEVILHISRSGYLGKRISVNLTGVDELDLSSILLSPDSSQDLSFQNTISLSEEDMVDDEAGFDNISGILQSTRDAYFSAAAFDFSQTFYRVRGLGSEYGTLMINGVEMNKAYNGRPQWSNWGGLNDVQRNQVFTSGISPSEYDFGGLGGTTNIIMRASRFASGGRITASGSNRSYTGRLMATYASGEQNNGWFYAFSIGRRYATEGYMEGTPFDANSVYLGLEKIISPAHSLNVTAIYTPTLRGKSAPLTQEVVEIKGSRYNPYWGLQGNEIRNSRLKNIQEPIFMLSHFWNPSKNLHLNTNLSYQFGEVSNTRIDYGGTSFVDFESQRTYLGGASNPDPVYYQKLPGYFLRFEGLEDFQKAYLSEKELVDKGQLNWTDIYKANTSPDALYALAADVNRDRNFVASSILNLQLDSSLQLISSFKISSLNSQNFARIEDLFGASSFLDVEVFTGFSQNDLRNPDRKVFEGQDYKYNYDLTAQKAEVFAQLQKQWRSWELSISGQASASGYQRFGNYQNEAFPVSSFGSSQNVDFLTSGFKTHLLHKFSGRQSLELNLAAYSKAPHLKNTFINPRQNNLLAPGISEEIIKASDLSYRYRTNLFNLRITGYAQRIANSTEVSFYYTDGLSGLGRENSTAFVQEVLSDIDKQLLGVELSSEYQVTSTIKVKLAGGSGQFIYKNNPALSLYSGAFDNLDYERSFLKGYRLPGGSQSAFQLGFEYRDPAYWWFGISQNYFTGAFIDVSPLTRTSNFQKDYDGLELVEYDATIARQLLEQEQFDPYFLTNIIGGKSWRIRDKYLGFFASINNALNTTFRTGGFEQARNANYRTLKEDRDREIPIFGNKYWYGNGTSYFVNLNLRF
ncbi:TonB-dependent receptor plug domain-containing protein [Christiangramia portivictoriae]|uniref:TonB-dependent receptor plug domain-containing protein n=1 Tax=Christiangramia portivictoriae TaxID=326069 RepID=UPI000415AE6E|nr:TonB-dependent receptor plug domain-containing protein [Christiangramia portivictoriae]